jgi:uncharacterized protein (TIGR03086 family)
VSPAEHHRLVAGAFTEKVLGTADWDAPAPVDGWVARDVVDHLVTWLPEFLGSRGLPCPPAGPSAREDPVGAWRAHAAGVQALLDGPAADVRVDDPYLGGRLDEVIDRIYTADVFMHTWDLARATGQDDTLDAGACAAMLEGMRSMEEAMRSSGHYGPRVEVPDDAGAQAQLLGFIGRDPSWSAPPTRSGPST